MASPWSSTEVLGSSSSIPLEQVESAVKVGDVLKLLRKNGWVLARTRGSHRQYKHPTKPGVVTVAGKPGDELATDTLKSVLKQAGLE